VPHCLALRLQPQLGSFCSMASFSCQTFACLACPYPPYFPCQPSSPAWFPCSASSPCPTSCRHVQHRAAPCRQIRCHQPRAPEPEMKTASASLSKLNPFHSTSSPPRST